MTAAGEALLLGDGSQQSPWHTSGISTIERLLTSAEIELSLVEAEQCAFALEAQRPPPLLYSSQVFRLPAMGSA